MKKRIFILLEIIIVSLVLISWGPKLQANQDGPYKTYYENGQLQKEGD